MRPLSDLEAERLKPVTALILDVDGVLTDGSIVYTDNGAELKPEETVLVKIERVSARTDTLKVSVVGSLSGQGMNAGANSAL